MPEDVIVVIMRKANHMLQGTILCKKLKTLLEKNFDDIRFTITADNSRIADVQARHILACAQRLQLAKQIELDLMRPSNENGQSYVSNLSACILFAGVRQLFSNDVLTNITGLKFNEFCDVFTISRAIYGSSKVLRCLQICNIKLSRCEFRLLWANLCVCSNMHTLFLRNIQSVGHPLPDVAEMVADLVLRTNLRIINILNCTVRGASMSKLVSNMQASQRVFEFDLGLVYQLDFVDLMVLLPYLRKFRTYHSNDDERDAVFIETLAKAKNLIFIRIHIHDSEDRSPLKAAARLLEACHGRGVKAEIVF